LPGKGYSSVTLPTNLIARARRVLRSEAGRTYRSLSDLVSEALDEKLGVLKGTPVLSIRDVTKEQARREVLDYLKRNPGFHYPSEVAAALALDPELVFEVTQSLLQHQIVETKSRKELEAR